MADTEVEHAKVNSFLKAASVLSVPDRVATAEPGTPVALEMLRALTN